MEDVGSRERSNYPVAVSVDDVGDGFEIGAQVTAAVGALRLCGLMEEAIRGLVTALATRPGTRMRALDLMPPVEEALLRAWA